MTAPHITTPLGTIIGSQVTSYEDIKVHRYLGIPYAHSPSGSRRFADPKPMKKLPTDPYNAQDYGNSCPQQPDTSLGDFKGSDMWNAKNTQSEDCLNLNLWVPDIKGKDIPVMVWIYGGGFYNGTSSLDIYKGEILAAFGKVIVASFNYRTGVLGFFSTGDGRIKGNYGLKDQLVALQWIKDNIAYFGGDPENITVFGESAGSSSIGFHLMSPLFSEGLFHKAIFESGSPKSRWSFMTSAQAKERSNQFLQKVEFKPDNNNEDVIKYLRNLDIKTILEHDWIDCKFMGYPWVPTIDGEYLLDEPIHLIKQKKMKFVDSIFGCNKDEGAMWCLTDLPPGHFSREDQHCFQTYTSFETNCDIMNSDLPLDIRQEIKDHYTQNQIRDTSDEGANRDAITDVAGDRGFIWPTIELADLFSEVGYNSYLYYLTYRASNDVWPEWMGVLHAAEIQWLFGLPFQDENIYTSDERNLSKTVMTLMTNFAKSGNPSTKPIEWPAYTHSDDKKHLEIKSPHEFHIGSKLRHNFCQFWQQISEKVSCNN